MKLKEHSFPGGKKLIEATDSSSGLHAFIGIHDTTLGPALGGTRIWAYEKTEDAIFDVCRLAEGMSYKSALAETGFGGGKSVIIAKPGQKSDALFHAFGKAVDSLGGEYICAEDVGSTSADMMIIRQVTPYVAGLPVKQGSGDPGRFTAYGVYLGIKAVAEHLWASSSLFGKRVAIQGLGSVGSRVAEWLFWEGAELILSDIDQEKAAKLAQHYQARLASPTEILTVECDILCPCAMGGAISTEVIPHIRAKAIAGAANNQLLRPEQDGQLLLERGILYAPDFVINAGGVINVASELHPDRYNAGKAMELVRKSSDTLLAVLRMADERTIPTGKMAIELAKDRIAHGFGKRTVGVYYPQ